MGTMVVESGETIPLCGFGAAYEGDAPCYHFVRALCCPAIVKTELAAVAHNDEATFGATGCLIFHHLFGNISDCVHGCGTMGKIRERFGGEKKGCLDACYTMCFQTCALTAHHHYVRGKLQAQRWGDPTGGVAPGRQ